MILSFPLALLAILPWAALVWLLGRSVGTPRPVPFLHLWPARTVSARHRRRLPLLPVLLALAGLLLAILAASGPAVRSRTHADATLLLDRGASMSASMGRQTRLTRLLTLLQQELAHENAVLHLQAVPPDPDLPSRVALSDLSTLSPAPTAAGTRLAVAEAVARERAADRAVLVLSDQVDAPTDEAPAVLAAGGPLPDNLALLELRLAHDDTGPSAPLVRVENAWRAPDAHREIAVEVSTPHAGHQSAHPLPPPGEQAWLTIPLPPDHAPIDGVVEQVTVRLLPSPPDAWQADDVLITRLTNPWPRIEFAAGLAAPVSRVLSIISDLRPPAPASPTIRVSTDPLAPEQPGIWHPPAITPAAGDMPVAVEALPFLEGLALARLADVALADPPAQQGWQSVVVADDRPLIAVREAPARQIWIGFDTTVLADDPAFVQFWADAIEWLGNGPPRWETPFVSDPAILELAPAAAVARGRERGENLPRVSFTRPAGEDLAELAGLFSDQIRRHPAMRPLAAPLLAVGLALLLAAGLLGMRREGGDGRSDK